MTERICEAGPENIPALVKMALDLWPENTAVDLTRSFLESLSSKQERNFLYRIDDVYAGFIMVSIRQDYVEGCSSKPVGYIEGIYVEPTYRKKGMRGSWLPKAKIGLGRKVAGRWGRIRKSPMKLV
jgi:aminoglycoside 6'-N-acetyltransferase I